MIVEYLQNNEIDQVYSTTDLYRLNLRFSNRTKVLLEIDSQYPRFSLPLIQAITAASKGNKFIKFNGRYFSGEFWVTNDEIVLPKSRAMRKQLTNSGLDIENNTGQGHYFDGLDSRNRPILKPVTAVYDYTGELPMSISSISNKTFLRLNNQNRPVSIADRQKVNHYNSVYKFKGFSIIDSANAAVAQENDLIISANSYHEAPRPTGEWVARPSGTQQGDARDRLDQNYRDAFNTIQQFNTHNQTWRTTRQDLTNAERDFITGNNNQWTVEREDAYIAAMDTALDTLDSSISQILIDQEISQT